MRLKWRMSYTNPNKPKPNKKQKLSMLKDIQFSSKPHEIILDQNLGSQIG